MTDHQPDADYERALERLLAAVVLELDAARANAPGTQFPELLGAWEAMHRAKPWSRESLLRLGQELEGLEP